VAEAFPYSALTLPTTIHSSIRLVFSLSTPPHFSILSSGFVDFFLSNTNLFKEDGEWDDSEGRMGRGDSDGDGRRYDPLGPAAAEGRGAHLVGYASYTCLPPFRLVLLCDGFDGWFNSCL
jgi:hypothetical protein